MTNRRKESASSETSKALARLEERRSFPGDSLMPRIPRPRVEDDGPVQLLGDEANLGALGLVEVKLTAEEERVLSRPIDDTRVLVKPTGQPYLPHAEYTKWFNEAFGRLGWCIVPKARPVTNGPNVIVPYVLYIHGKPAAFAYGEQDYHEGNREQTYGDAAEATVASALRRVAKRLGVSAELWDRTWVDAWVRENCIAVPVLKNRKTSSGWRKVEAFQWRRKADPPFPEEIDPKTMKTAEGDDYNAEDYRGQDYERPQRRQTRDTRPAGHNPRDGEFITEKQVNRLWVIVRNSGRSDEQVKEWLRRRFGLDTSKKILRGDYEFICNAIESEASLPMPRD